MATTEDVLATSSASTSLVQGPLGITTDSLSENSFVAATKFGVIETESLSRNYFEADAGYLATGRYRR